MYVCVCGISVSFPLSLVLNQERFLSSFLVEFWQCLDLFLAVKTWRYYLHLVAGGQDSCSTSCSGVAPTTKNFPAKMTTATRVRSPVNFYSRSDVWSTSHNSGAAVHSGLSQYNVEWILHQGPANSRPFWLWDRRLPGMGWPSAQGSLQGVCAQVDTDTHSHMHTHTHTLTQYSAQKRAWCGGNENHLSPVHLLLLWTLHSKYDSFQRPLRSTASFKKKK